MKGKKVKKGGEPNWVKFNNYLGKVMIAIGMLAFFFSGIFPNILASMDESGLLTDTGINATEYIHPNEGQEGIRNFNLFFGMIFLVCGFWLEYQNSKKEQ